MKILHVITLSDLGGAQSVVMNLVINSLTDGHVVMVAAAANGDLWSALPANVLQRPIKTLQRKIQLKNDLLSIYELRKAYKDFHPDAIHLHSSKAGILGRIAFPVKKIIYTVHGFDSIRIAFRKFLPLERMLQRRAAHIVAVSNYDQRNLKNEGIEKKVTCIYNGIIDYKKVFKGFELRNFEFKNSKFQDSNQFKVVCIARLASPKRFDLFCEIATLLIGNNIGFYWIGNKEFPEKFPINVRCLGEIRDAHQLLPFFDVFLLPSDYEGMPISILEALCYGIPVLASNVGGICEILDGNNGFALENDANLFSSHILNFKQNKTLHIFAKNYARKSYLQRFTTDKMYNSYLKLYESIGTEK